MALSRRTFLHTTGAGVLGTLALPVFAYGADSYDALRARWRDLLIGVDFDPSASPYAPMLAAIGRDAISLQSSMTPAAAALWSDLPLNVSLSMATSYSRLRTMALAHVQPHTGVTGDPRLLADVIGGLDYLHEHVFNESTVRFDNWYHWNIGAPEPLLDICVLLHDELTTARIGSYIRSIDHFAPKGDPPGLGASTGANRVDQCQVLALIGIVGKEGHRLEVARDGLSAVFPFVTTGDGFYSDGSFIQHTRLPYQGGYGAVLLRGIANLLYLLEGSQWAVTDPQRQNIFDAVMRSFAPFIYNGLCMDGVSGRGISRGVSAIGAPNVQQDDHTRGHAITAAILRLAQAAAPGEATAWRRMVKGWMERESWGRLAEDPSLAVPDRALCLAVRNDRAVRAVPEPITHAIFNNSDRAVHRRAGWAAAISMCSARIAHYEKGNGENLHGWHTSAGMLYWWPATHDNGQYGDAFWPTVDPYRLPGTTVARKTLAADENGSLIAPTPAAVWVGGVTDGEFAALGQHVNGFESTLTARKSWFCLDDAIVCLGAGITCADGVAVETTIENRNLGENGAPTFLVDGREQLAAAGTAIFTDTKWAAIVGYGAYVFPSGVTIHAARETRQGRWRDINIRSSDDLLRRQYLTLWFDHGIDPRDDRYAYMLMPGAGANAAIARAQAVSWLNVLANDAGVQAVSVPSLGVVAVNFWTAGAIGGISADGPCAVLIRERKDATTVAVSDPSRTGSVITVACARRRSRVISHAPSVTVLSTGEALQLKVAVGGTAGATHLCEVAVP